MRALSGWRPSLRMAWREARRSRGRSILVLAMIALPVLAVTAADIVIATQDVSGVESVDRRIGAADASVSFTDGAGRVIQAFDPDDGMTWDSESDRPTPGVADVRRALGRDVRTVERFEGSVVVSTDRGRTDAMATEVDLADPLASGLYDLTAGRWPRTADEVVVNADLASRGPGLGEEVELASGDVRRVVGIAESSTYRSSPSIAGPVGSLGLAEQTTDHTWLLGAGPVTWDDVLALNALGGTVVSRAVIADPPPDSVLDPEIASWAGGTDDAWLAIVALVVVMALLEVVLLAGPAFAVTARRQSRTLALMAAAGGTPRQGRRVILAYGLVLGGLAAVLGVGLGIVAGRVAVPVVQRWDSTWFGPFDVPWPHLLGIAAFGLLSAVLAAVVPAWIASRQDVVAVLGGRRGDRKASLRSPILGVVLLGAGVAGAAYGARSASNGEFAIAASAVVAVLGMILLVPLVVVTLARVGRRLPLVLRYAVRDAARHRTRTVPAVAAVAATVAGVVALGIALSSDELENRATYSQQVPMGDGVVSFGWNADATAADAAGVVAAAEKSVPGLRATAVRGVRTDRPDGSYTYLSFAAPGGPQQLLSTYGGTFGSDVLVADRVPPGDHLGIDPAGRERADAALSAGGVVAFADARLADEVTGLDRVRARVEEMDAEGRTGDVRTRTFPGAVVTTRGQSIGPQAILSTAAARRLGVPVVPANVLLDGAPISRGQQRDLDEAVSAIADRASVYVERGYRAPGETVVVQLVLAGLGAVLMLGGTLTATFLALSDARPDLATLAAVGASPRKRRGVAASYALVVGLVGALLGAAVGFIPGIAVTYPLTGSSWDPNGADVSHYLDVPWLLIGGLVVVLPLLTAAIVWVSARSRLPMVARLD